MITLISNFCLSQTKIPEGSSELRNVLSASFLCGINYPIHWPSVSDKVVAHSFALKPATESEMTDLHTTIVRMNRIG